MLVYVVTKAAVDYVVVGGLNPAEAAEAQEFAEALEALEAERAASKRAQAEEAASREDTAAIFAPSTVSSAGMAFALAMEAVLTMPKETGRSAPFGAAAAAAGAAATDCGLPG